MRRPWALIRGCCLVGQWQASCGASTMIHRGAIVMEEVKECGGGDEKRGSKGNCRG